MKAACVAALSFMLTAFAPERGVNTMVCRTDDLLNHERMEVKFDFNVIGDEYFVMSDIKMEGMYRENYVSRTIRGNTVTLEKQTDVDGVKRVTFQTQPGAPERLKWTLRDDPSSDAVEFRLPGTETQPANFGTLLGYYPGSSTAPPEANAATIAVNGIPVLVRVPDDSRQLKLRRVVAGCAAHRRR